MKTRRVTGFALLLIGFSLGVIAVLSFCSKEGFTATYAERIAEVTRTTQGEELESAIRSELWEYQRKIRHLLSPNALGPALMLAGGLILAYSPRRKDNNSNKSMDCTSQ